MTLKLIKEKLVLGTVQLGLPYGINNSQGKPDVREAFLILDLASKHHVRLLDTADVYGDSVATIGQYLAQHPTSRFEIINKFTDDNNPLATKLSNTLSTLHLSSLYAYMFHRFSDYNSRKFQSELKSLKEQNKIQRVGVSVYTLDELSAAIDDDCIDLVQLSLNPLDYTLEKKALLKQAKANGKEIHVRSIFLQGLFFKSPKTLTGNLKQLYEPLRDFHQLLDEHQLDVRRACLNYALHQGEIDHVLIGVETVVQLQENLDAIESNFSKEVMKQMESIAIPDRMLLNPSSWRP